MAAVTPPGDDDRWASGFELPMESAEGEMKRAEGESACKDTDKPKPTKKAETIRGTATVNQPGPNLAERPAQETSAEYFASWAEAERMMKADLETGKFTREQIEEVKILMEGSAEKMKLPKKEAHEELTIEQLKEKVEKLEAGLKKAELKIKGPEGDKYVAQLMALQDQLNQAVVERLKVETLNAKLEREWKEAIVKIDEAAQEKRDKKDQNNNEKEDGVKKAEAEKHANALCDKDDRIRLLEQELDALSKRIETEENEREKTAAKDTDKEKMAEIQLLQKQALENDETIRKLEKDLEAEKLGNDLEEAGYHGGEELKVIIKRLEREKKQLKKEAVKMGVVINSLNEKIRGLESSQVRVLDAAINVEQREKARKDPDKNLEELRQRVQHFEDEEQLQIEREHALIVDRQTLGAQVLRQQTEINEWKEKLNQSKEQITEFESTIKILRKAVADSSGELGREFVTLGEEIKKLERRVREQDVKISQQESEIRAQKKKIGEQERELRKRQTELEDQVDDYEQEIEELNATTKQSEDLISVMTADHEALQKTMNQLKLELVAATTRSIDDTGGVGGAPVDATEREWAYAEKTKDLTERNTELSGEVNALKEESKKVRKSLTGTDTDAKMEKHQLSQQQAHASVQTVQMLMGFMILQRALNGKVSGDMNSVLAAVDQARLQAEAIGDEKLIVEISYLVAIAAYYDGDTPKALASFIAVKDSKHWHDSEKDAVRKWIAKCEEGADCPRGRSGYREALGFGPVPPSFRAPLKLTKDKDDKEAKKGKKAAKPPEAGSKPRRASVPKCRGIHRPDLYVGILSPRQQQIWDTIDFSDFDYNHLTPEQQSLFSFSPIDSETESPRRPVVHRAAGPSTKRSRLPDPRPRFELPLQPSPSVSSSNSEEPPPTPPAIPRPPRKTKPRRPASSGASFAVSGQGAQGVQEEQPSRMSRPTTDAALHIQYLVAQLAESVRRIKELERADADVVSLSARVGRRDVQIEELRSYCEQIIAENTTLRDGAQVVPA